MQIPATLKRFADRIESIDDERGTQNGYWVNLKDGWIDRESGCHAIHEDTLSACAFKFAFVAPCECEDCRRSKARKVLRSAFPRVAGIEIEAFFKDGSFLAIPSGDPSGSYTISTYDLLIQFREFIEERK